VRRTALAAALALLCLVVASGAAAAPVLPTRIIIVPSYGATKHIRVSWTESAGGGHFNIYKRIDTNPEALLTTVSASAVGHRHRFLDTLVVPSAEYTYRLEACNATGCVSAPAFKTALKVVWPISGGRRLIDGFNESIAWAGVGEIGATGFHFGVDLGRTTVDPAAGDDVRAPRGGLVVDANVSGATDDGFVQVAVDIGDGRFEFDGFNHMRTGGGGLSVMVGDVVVPGQKLGVIGTLHFNDPLTAATSFDDHVHFQLGEDGRQFDGAIRNPLTIFTDPADRDPGSAPPGLHDENGDGRVVIYRNHATRAIIAYDFTTTPLLGDVDVEAEVTDVQGTKPHTVPVELGYWIEGPLPDAEHVDDVKSATHPYKLFDFHTEYWGRGTPVNCRLVTDIADVANYGCRGVDAVGCAADTPGTSTRGACNSTLKEAGNNVSWWWPIFHHYVVTHAATETGARTGLNNNQFWRTAAKDDGQPAGTAHANYASQPTTDKAWEARFPDGDYTIHLVASDLVHTNVDLKLPVARLENFAPFVKEIELALDADGSAATGLPGLPGCEVPAYEYKHPARTKYPDVPRLAVARAVAALTPLRAGTLCVRVHFSEPMSSATVELVAQRGTGAARPVAGAFEKRFADNDTWHGTIALPVDPSGASDFSPVNDEKDTAIRIVASDRRNAAGNLRLLDRDGDGTGDAGGDVNHLVKLDLSPPKKSVDAVIE
jgi:hypothetical protein